MASYEELSIERKKAQENGDLPEWYQTAGYQLLKEKYLWKNSTLKETFKRMADVASSHLKGKLPDSEVEYLNKRFFEIMWDGDLAPASPVYNLGTNRGMAVSCSGGFVPDTVVGFYSHRLEMAKLTKEQFGTSGYLGAIRPRGSKISSGGTACGVLPVFNGIAQDMLDITQGTLRRGSYGAYIDIEHGDVDELITSLMSEPEGKNIGFNYTNNSIRRVLSNDVDDVIFKKWQRHMKLRAVYGKGYFYFPEKVEKLQPAMYKDQKEFVFEYDLDQEIGVYSDNKEKSLTAKDIIDLFDKGENVRVMTPTKTLLTVYKYEFLENNKVKVFTKRILKSLASNLCTEITLHSDELHTYACVLSSMNATTYDKWKNTDAVYVATIFLDCVNEELIKQCGDDEVLAKIKRSAEKGRPLGLGLLGFHTYLQENMMPFESVEAMMFNDELFEHLNKESLRASQYLAKHLGEPEWCEGYGVRNTHRTALAPNMSSALLAGCVSQGIEPILSNVYQQKMAGGTVNRISRTLLRIMKERGVYSQELVDEIGMKYKGSVQSPDITFLTPHEKLVFKTANEINQKVILDLANDRQPNICQAQSINTFFKASATESEVADVTQYGMSLPNIKSLYYQRSEATSKGSSGKAEVKEVECIACEA